MALPRHYADVGLRHDGRNVVEIGHRFARCQRVSARSVGACGLNHGERDGVSGKLPECGLKNRGVPSRHTGPQRSCVFGPHTGRSLQDGSSLMRSHTVGEHRLKKAAQKVFKAIHLHRLKRHRLSFLSRTGRSVSRAVNQHQGSYRRRSLTGSLKNDPTTHRMTHKRGVLNAKRIELLPQ